MCFLALWIATPISSARNDGEKLKINKSRAAGFADDFVGCQAVGEGIYLSGNEQAHRADSRKSAAKPTPFKRNNATLQKHYA